MVSRAEDISSRLADTLRGWIGTAEQHDDLTFVVVTVNRTGRDAPACSRSVMEKKAADCPIGSFFPYLGCLTIRR